MNELKNFKLADFCFEFAGTLNQMNPCKKAFLYVSYNNISWIKLAKIVFKAFYDCVFAIKIW